MNDLHENESRTAYQCWSQTVTGMLACEWKLFESQYQVGLRIVEVALRLPGGSGTNVEVRGGTAPQAADEFPRLESLAFERTRVGLAPPREIYELPYRDRVDWSQFPEWARPVDPELFQDCGHEG